MKKKIITSILSVLVVTGLLTGFGEANITKTIVAKAAEKSSVTLKVGAAVVPHAEILNFIKPKLLKQGINLDVVVLDDEGQLNPALKDKEIDANYFQHVPYLNSVAKEQGYDFSVVANVHVEPIGLYSSKIKKLSALKNGALIAIPNNPSNEYRSLVLLQSKGLIKLKSGIADYKATPKDIISNPKKLKFIEVDAAQFLFLPCTIVHKGYKY